MINTMRQLRKQEAILIVTTTQAGVIALISLGTSGNTAALTIRLANIVSSWGQDWYLLSTGAFVSMIVPLIVFFSLQSFFVRGLLDGSVKG